MVGVVGDKKWQYEIKCDIMKSYIKEKNVS